MSVLKCKVELLLEVDTEEYPIPADGKLLASLKEDVKDAIESTVAVSIENIKAVRVSFKHDEIRD